MMVRIWRKNVRNGVVGGLLGFLCSGLHLVRCISSVLVESEHWIKSNSSVLVESQHWIKSNFLDLQILDCKHKHIVDMDAEFYRDFFSPECK